LALIFLANPKVLSLSSFGKISEITPAAMVLPPSLTANLNPLIRIITGIYR
jgi:hypothetical protein